MMLSKQVVMGPLRQLGAAAREDVMAVLLRRSLLGTASLLLLALPGLPGGLHAQPAQPAAWCLSWTDNCTACTRSVGDSTPACTTKPGRCVAGRVRCTKAHERQLRDACERPKFIRAQCNVCSAPDAQGRQMCTLRGCPISEIVCERSR